MDLITKLSGLLKAITHTIRVMVSSVFYLSGTNFNLRISATIPVDGQWLSRHTKFVKGINPGRWIGIVSVNNIV